jgi:monoamine oxidase
MTQNFGDELGGNPERWHKIKGGSDLLPRAFAEKLAGKIRYGSPVVKIEQNATQARVVFLNTGRQESATADSVVCTIPFSILRKIEMQGVSERKKKIIKNTQYDAVSRVYLQAKNRVWEEKGLNGFAFTSGAIEIWQPTWDQPGPRGILMTYARPGEAERITNMKESERIADTLKQLDPMFGGVRENFERGFTKCWVEDEWARGAWAFVGLGDFFTASSPEGRIHFAGEHLSPWYSWMQGALSSGLKAVKEIDATAKV